MNNRHDGERDDLVDDGIINAILSVRDSINRLAAGVNLIKAVGKLDRELDQIRSTQREHTAALDRVEAQLAILVAAQPSALRSLHPSVGTPVPEGQ